MRRLIALICLIFPLLALSKGPKAPMDSFRYEIYRDGTSAVYYVHKTSEGTSLYYRDAGSAEGWRFASIDNGAIGRLAKIWKKSSLASHAQTGLDTEDKSRDRWIIEASFGTGAKHSIIEYLESPRSEEDVRLEDEVTACIHALIAAQEASGSSCARSKCIYSHDGSLLRRIDYAPDGTVLGGYDALDPFAEF